MKKYKVIYLPLFYEDLAGIVKYITYNLKNKSAAERLIDKVKKEIDKRSYNPTIFEKYQTLKKRKKIYYRIYINNYTIFYTVEREYMVVSRMLYSKRNIRDLIE